MERAYDSIGRDYRDNRTPDPRIARLIETRLEGADRVVNIGAGTGSYEPRNRGFVAVEPSAVMLAQRPAGSAPAIQAVAEALPFVDSSFDLAMGILTVHHWTDWRQGLREAMRVSGGNVLLLTWFGFNRSFWLTDYFPQINTLDNARFPTEQDYRDLLGDFDSVSIPIPHDCTDGFMCAYWRRPGAYLDPAVRNNISTFALFDGQEQGLRALEGDLASGRWMERYGELMTMESCDFGYKLLHSRGGRGVQHAEQG